MKLDKDGNMPSDDDRIAERDSKKAVAVVNSFKYRAITMYYYPIWPGQGEIREELEKLGRMNLFERDELFIRYGQMTRDERINHDNAQRAQHPDAEEIKPNHAFYPGEEWYAILN